jgi:signal transduction histidine kinase
LQGPETDPETVAYLKDRISVGLPFNCEIINYSKSAKSIGLVFKDSFIQQRQSNHTLFCNRGRYNSKEILENQREELVNSLASNKELEDYAHIVSHDLKSPLRSIHSLLSWIKEDNEDKLSRKPWTIGMIENKVEKWII